jgi:DNA-binding XRE family transcriptional regulator
MTKRTLVAKITRQYRNRVRECRLRSMIPKQEDLARMTGISRGTISALENNRLFLSSHYALLIAEALRCRVDDLYENLHPREGLTAARTNTPEVPGYE